MERTLPLTLARQLQQAQQAFGLPSVSAAALCGGEEACCALGLADREQSVAATPDTVYAIGSSTKAFLATSLCLLAAEGKLSLDAPVRAYLPWFRLAEPQRTAELTVRDALCHRSGLPRHDLSWLNNPGRTLVQQVEALAHLPAAWPIRSRFYYQNHMFMTATLLVEAVSGCPWTEFVRRRLLEPLGMAHTYLFGDELADGDPCKARPYERRDGALRRMPYNYAKSVAGAGTIYASTRDMLRWLRFQLNGDSRILTRPQLAELHRPQMLIKEGEMFPFSFPEITFPCYGLGWFTESYRGTAIVHHGGTIDGFKSEQLFVPGRGIAVSLLCNLDQTKAVTALGYSLLDALLDLPARDWNGRYLAEDAKAAAQSARAAADAEAQARTGALPCAAPERYAGRYRHPAYGEVAVRLRETGLVLEVAGETVPLTFLGKDRFFYPAAHYLAPGTARFSGGADRPAVLYLPLEPALPEPLPFCREAALSAQ